MQSRESPSEADVDITERSGHMPSRTQQLGLILFLAALIVYVIARVGW